MTTPEMHVMFRQYAQQMGMQNVRAILPEQIDLLLNTSQIDIINDVIKQNINITNDRIITDNSKIGQINALRSLYHVHYIDMSPYLNQSKESRTFVFNASDRFTGRMTTDFDKIDGVSLIPQYMYLVDFSINYKKVKNKLGYSGFSNVYDSFSVLTPNGATNNSENYLYHNVSTSVIISAARNEETNELEEYDFNLANGFLVTHAVIDASKPLPYYLYCKKNSNNYYLSGDISVFDQTNNINPCVVNTGKKYAEPIFEIDGFETNYFPVRIIDDIYLADTLNDFVLKNRMRTPIMVIYNKKFNDNNYNVFDLYIDKFKKTSNDRYVLDGDLLPYKLRMSYISQPRKIEYKEDMGEDNINCELPNYMHIDVVKHAVDLYRITISGSMMAAQQQEQNARQENMRNNYRNEGNAQ